MYKKSIFMVNSEESLKILSNYNDFETYHMIYKQKILKVPVSTIENNQ